MAVTKLADIIVPEVFTPYSQQLTQEKSRIIQSGIATVEPLITGFLSGGGMTFNIPSFTDLDASDATGPENVSTDDETSDSVPDKMGTAKEVGIRLSRNNSWSTMDLTAALAGTDPADAIAQRVGTYWARRLQRVFVESMNGVIADNVAADAGDYVHDIKGGAFVDGVTNFSAEAFIDAAVTMGDSADEITGMLVHSVVYARMQKNNLIDFIPDAEGRVNIPTFLGRQVVVDDGMPVTAGVYDTWLFGTGAARLGLSVPKVPTETDRAPAAGDGSGQETLYSRVEWVVHPVGHAYVGATTAGGGPTNATLALAASWNRVYSERKQIKFARLVTREA